MPAVASPLQLTRTYVRDVVHACTERGFVALDPQWSGDRPAKTDPTTRERICQIARCCPCDLGLPFSVWSLAKLAEHLAGQRIAQLSRETLRHILRSKIRGPDYLPYVA